MSEQSAASVQSAVARHCTEQPPDTIFTQESLLQTGLIPENSVSLLHQALMNLTKANELKLMQRGGQACWRCINNSTRSVHKTLDAEALLIYNYIESSGREGMLASALNRRTNFHKATMDKSIKTLEQKRLIKTVANYRHPKRKTFMLWGLQPLEDVTGGPFYSGGELDEEFVNILCWWIERWIVARSWSFPTERSKPGKRKRVLSGEDLEPVERETGLKRSLVMRPHSPGFQDYPSIGEVTRAVNSSGMAKETMKISDVQQLVDILCWDGKVERIVRDADDQAEIGYRAVRTPLIDSDRHVPVPGLTSDERKTPPIILGFTEAPCGQCPVFDDCEEGGLVSAKTCPYFQAWLEI